MNTKLLPTYRPALRTGLRAGNFASNNCYISRNLQNFACWLGIHDEETGLPIPCATQEELKNCLSVSQEPDWWKDFPELTHLEACMMTRNNLRLRPDDDQLRELMKANGCPGL